MILFGFATNIHKTFFFFYFYSYLFFPGRSLLLLLNSSFRIVVFCFHLFSFVCLIVSFLLTHVRLSAFSVFITDCVSHVLCPSICCVGSAYALPISICGSAVSSVLFLMLSVKVFSSKVIIQYIDRSCFTLTDPVLHCQILFLKFKLMKIFIGAICDCSKSPRAPIVIGTIVPLLHCTCSNLSSCNNFSYFLILSCLLCSKYWLLVSYGIVTSTIITSSSLTMVISCRSSSIPIVHDLSL